MTKKSMSEESGSFEKSKGTELEQILKRPVIHIKFLLLIGGLSAMIILPALTFAQAR